MSAAEIYIRGERYIGGYVKCGREIDLLGLRVLGISHIYTDCFVCSVWSLVWEVSTKEHCECLQ